ncbi:hypothetical protein DSO57_1034188 [Entomophthora muscae]|uniref:Uncharacterized protein n=1 Tax=Entomophthora muscae TaxID=34485 RepID=A0ACC2SNZ7_9FUNG|nr:hypothetical protein DSO57_1034188 [Entomophthora muscae]
MTSPHTLQLNCPQESVATDESTSTQVFGVMYIILTGLIDSMVPTSGPWAVLVKLLSYIVKLAPILWWALPAEPAGCLPASSQEPPTGWIPESLLPTLPVIRTASQGSGGSVCHPSATQAVSQTFQMPFLLKTTTLLGTHSFKRRH